MKECFAKLIETPERQILVTMDVNSTTAPEVIVQTVNDGIRLKASASFDNKDDQEAFFNNFDDLEYTNMFIKNCFGFALTQK